MIAKRAWMSGSVSITQASVLPDTYRVTRTS